VAALGLAFAACDGDSSGSGASSGGQGGEGGCPLAPAPLFTLTVTAPGGSVPPDTHLVVRWSAAEEPLFALDDPSTWKSLDEGANVVCNVGGSAPPEELDALVCELWTSGATEIEIGADHYVTQRETFTPPQSDLCEGPVPSAIAMALVREDDAGSSE